MAEYIKRDAAIREIEQINPVDYGAMWDYEAHHWAGECLRDCKEAIDRNGRGPNRSAGAPAGRDVCAGPNHHGGAEKAEHADLEVHNGT